MRRIASLVTILTLLVSLGFQAGLASAAPGSTTSPHLARSQDIGDPVSIPDIDGNEIGTVTVTDFQEDFTDFSETAKDDLQYVSVGLSIENTSKDAISVEPGNIAVVDDRGLIYTDIVVTRDDNADELESTQVEPGDTLEGYIEIGFPAKRTLAQMVWVVGQGQLVTLMNNADPIAEGDAVRLYDQDYTRLGTITVDSFVANFDDFAKDLEIQDGYLVSAATFTIENTGDEDLIPDPTSFFIATTDGVFWQPDASIKRSKSAIADTPDLTADPIAPGDSVTGVVTYSILDTQTADYLFYLPDSYRLVRLWDNPDKDVNLGGGNDATPAATEEDNGDLGPVGGKKTPEAEPTKKTTGGNADCDGYADYNTASLKNVSAWGDAITSIDFRNIMTVDPADVTAVADEIRDLAKAQEQLDIPAAAVDANDLLVQAFKDSADAIDTLAQGVTDGDAAAIGEAASVLSEIGASFSNGDVANAIKDLEAACA